MQRWASFQTKSDRGSTTRLRRFEGAAPTRPNRLLKKASVSMRRTKSDSAAKYGRPGPFRRAMAELCARAGQPASRPVANDSPWGPQDPGDSGGYESEGDRTVDVAVFRVEPLVAFDPAMTWWYSD